MSLWRNKSFLLLFSAQVVSLTGSGVTTVALALFAHVEVVLLSVAMEWSAPRDRGAAREPS